MRRAKTIRKNLMTSLKGSRNDKSIQREDNAKENERTSSTKTASGSDPKKRSSRGRSKPDKRRADFAAMPQSALGPPSESLPPQRPEPTRQRTKSSSTRSRSRRIRDTETDDRPSAVSQTQLQSADVSQSDVASTAPINEEEILERIKAEPDYQKIARAAQALDDAGNNLFEKGQYDEAMHSYTRALKLKRKTLKIGGAQDPLHKDNLLASVATSINNIGYLRQRSGATSEEIMSAYQDSLQIKKEILGPNDLSVGKTLNNIGSVYFTTGHFHNAMIAYTQALRIMELNLGETHLDVATVHSNIGDVYMAKRELEKARQRYSDALKIRWSRLGDTDPKVIRLLEKVAAIEMADTPQKIKKGKLERQDSHDSGDVAFVPEVQKDLRTLRKEVRNDMVYVDRVKRELALDMVKDKIKIIKGMRSLDAMDGSDDLETTSTTKMPVQADDSSEKSVSLTPYQRKEALAGVKDRLAKLRERKRLGGDDSLSGASLTGSVRSYNSREIESYMREASARSLFSGSGRQVSSRSIVSEAVTINSGSSAGASHSSSYSSIQELRNRHDKLLSVKDRLEKIRSQKVVHQSQGYSTSVDSIVSGVSGSVGSAKSRELRDRHVGEVRPSSQNLAQYLESAK